MLELRPNCEHCNKILAPASTEAMICSFECTFCQDCVTLLQNVCPNCGGGFSPRPIRPSKNHKNDNCLAKFPGSSVKIFKPVDMQAHQAFAENIRKILPKNR